MAYTYFVQDWQKLPNVLYEVYPQKSMFLITKASNFLARRDFYASTSN